jgi:hypothetical protein
MLKRLHKVSVLEPHLAAGGLASLLREHLTVQIRSPAVPPQALAVVGSQDFLRRQAGIDAGAVMAAGRRIF